MNELNRAFQTMHKLPILMYHKVEEIPPRPGYLLNYVTPRRFAEHLEALRKWGYTPIALEHWLEARSAGTKLPESPVVFTFDDGFRSNYEIAWPILQKYDATATIFLVADFVGETNRWDVSEPQAPLLGAEEILRMQAGGIRFGSHTCTHRSLTELPKTSAWGELTKSRDKLEALLGHPVVSLAYPYNNNNFAVRRLARKTGYQAAVLGRGIVNAPWTNRWALRRILVHAETTIEELGQRLSSWRWAAGF